MGKRAVPFGREVLQLPGPEADAVGAREGRFAQEGARRRQLVGVDMEQADGVLAFEAAALKRAGVDFAPVPPRYRTTYFSHIMGGYSAGYYSYIWSEVLDADSVEWFKKNGGLTRKNGDHFRNTLLSRGGSEDAMVLFRNFSGGEPYVQPLLERRGLTQQGQ